MPKIGIAIDSWKLTIFARRLTAAGFEFEQSSVGGPGSLLLTVTTENFQKLKGVCEDAFAEATRVRNAKEN